MTTPTPTTEPAAADDLAAALAELESAPTHTPLMAGTFALYGDGKGGLVLVTETADGGVQRRQIPARLIKLATGGGILGSQLAKIFG